MGGKKRSEESTFAEILQNLPESSGHRSHVVPSILDSATYVDDDGVEWRRVTPVMGKTFKRLLLDPRVRVLHEYAGDVTTIPADARQQFWVAAGERMDASRYSSFSATRYKNEAWERLLVVHETC